MNTFLCFPHLAIHLLCALSKVTKLLYKMVGGDLDEAQHALHLPACEDRAERASHLHPGLISLVSGESWNVQVPVSTLPL